MALSTDVNNHARRPRLVTQLSRSVDHVTDEVTVRELDADSRGHAGAERERSGRAHLLHALLEHWAKL